LVHFGVNLVCYDWPVGLCCWHRYPSVRRRRRRSSLQDRSVMVGKFHLDVDDLRTALTEGVVDAWIEMAATPLGHDFQAFFPWEGSFVGAATTECIIHVRHRGNASFDGDVLTSQPQRISRAVPPFMVR